ncbi:MAG: glycerol kinase GlpK [Candidatus Natronoplasma sp.]
MTEKGTYVLALDEGTTSAKAFLIDRSGEVIGEGRNTFEQFFPKPGWVEHDPEEIWEMQLKSIGDAMKGAGVNADEITSIGITNQRETTVLWEKDSGKPVYNAIVWQDRRTAEMIDKIKAERSDMIKSKTGLIPDSYFSASKIKWLMENERTVQKRIDKGEVLFGTIDSFLIYKLTGVDIHATDPSNASRTMLFDIEELEWDPELLDLFDVPYHILPEIKESSDFYGYAEKNLLGREIPISGCLGDQQAALFGQSCFEKGMVKNTYGTGSFVLKNTGEERCRTENLLATVAWSLDGDVDYALEGSVFIAGAGIEWLKDSLGIIQNFEDAEKMAEDVKNDEEVYFVPAFVGLGAPHWDQYARGLIVGISRSTRPNHLAKAGLEAMGYLSRDVLDEMGKESGIKNQEIRVDGGAAKNDYLMQFQADILGGKILRPKNLETTALGAAYMAGLSVDFWKNKKELVDLYDIDKIYEPEMSEEERERCYRGWKKALKRSLGWSKQHLEV